MSQPDTRPEWIQKAAQAITAFTQQEQYDAVVARESLHKQAVGAKEGMRQDVQRTQEDLQAYKNRLKSTAKETEEKIADLIHQHFQKQK